MIKILVADDDIIVREGLKMIISSQEDMRVSGEAENGSEALALARELRPDVALLDIRMPECDGITAAENMLAEGGARRSCLRRSMRRILFSVL